MINTKEIIKRIGSVKNTKKITKAMEMIAAVKMRKSVQTATNTKDYSTAAYQILQKLSNLDVAHPLTVVKNKNEFAEVETISKQKTLLIVITSNRGLCGSYNAKILKNAQEIINTQNDVNEYSVLAIGNKAAQLAKRNNLELVALYDKLTDNPNYEEILPISKTIMQDFLDGKYSRVKILYTNYISGLVQKVTVKQLLPIKEKTLEEFKDKAGLDSADSNVDEIKEHNDSNFGEDINLNEEYDFEPKQKELLDYLLPMLVEIQLYQAVLESAASEHSSRMIAMKNATDSAGEMIDSLTLEYNKGRQAAITQEIAEIVSGANAQE